MTIDGIGFTAWLIIGGMLLVMVVVPMLRDIFEKRKRK